MKFDPEHFARLATAYEPDDLLSPVTEYPKRGPVFPVGYVVFFSVALAACVGAVAWAVWR